MLEFILITLSDLALEIQDFFFRKKKRKRRALEKEKGLPKKRMISPYQRVSLLMLFFIPIIGLVLFILLPTKNMDQTGEKIDELKVLLEEEKKIQVFILKN